MCIFSTLKAGRTVAVLMAVAGGMAGVLDGAPASAQQYTTPVVTKRLQLALNIPTFINLVGYGYENVWELADVIRTDGPGVDWVATAS